MVIIAGKKDFCQGAASHFAVILMKRLAFGFWLLYSKRPFSRISLLDTPHGIHGMRNELQNKASDIRRQREIPSPENCAGQLVYG
jgi:hypothetical protein